MLLFMYWKALKKKKVFVVNYTFNTLTANL